MQRHAIVTGAARGIGRAIADRLADDGWIVAALDRGTGPLAQEARHLVVEADVGAEADVARAFATIAERWGAECCDLLVNNAGLADPESGPVEELSLDGWNTWIGGHLTGTFLMTRSAVPLLRRRGGSIVNIASSRALMSEPDTEAYAAAKGGMVALTHALAISLGPDVRANAILPGWIDTAGEDLRDIDHAQHPVGRVGRPADVAEAVLYLAGAGFVTGQTLTVDGGMTRKMIYAE